MLLSLLPVQHYCCILYTGVNWCWWDRPRTMMVHASNTLATASAVVWQRRPLSATDLTQCPVRCTVHTNTQWTTCNSDASISTTQRSAAQQCKCTCQSVMLLKNGNFPSLYAHAIHLFHPPLSPLFFPILQPIPPCEQFWLACCDADI